MDKKILKQSIDKLDISDQNTKILKEEKIETIEELCKKSKKELKKFDIVQSDIRNIEIRVQLLGFNLKNSL